MAGTSARPVIVAGIDGSEDSKEALRWAVRQARFTGAEVHAVTAWQVPVTIFFVPSYTESDYHRDAEETLHKTVAEVLGDGSEATVIARTVQGRPATVLVHEAEYAELLVVGGHGRGELPGMHLGSVASYCVHHAMCPVTIVCQARR